MLKDKEPGSFIVRDSHSFRGAYGLAMKVATPPPSVLQLNKKGRCGLVCMLTCACGRRTCSEAGLAENRARALSLVVMFLCMFY